MSWFQRLALLGAALVALLLGVAAFLPSKIIGDLVSGAGQLEHALGFGLVSFLFVVAFPARWLLFSAAALAAGGMVEVLQPLAGRGAQWSDFGANTIGLFVGVAAALLVRRASKSG